MNLVKAGLTALATGILGYLIAGTIMFGVSTKVIGSGVASKMLANPIPIIVGVLCSGIALWLMLRP